MIRKVGRRCLEGRWDGAGWETESRHAVRGARSLDGDEELMGKLRHDVEEGVTQGPGPSRLSASP